jgi:hypothetical protein
MPDKRPSVKNEKQYEALKDKGMSKERAARIANSPKASRHGGERSHSGSGSSSQGERRRRRRPRGARVAERRLGSDPDVPTGPDGSEVTHEARPSGRASLSSRRGPQRQDLRSLG